MSEAIKKPLIKQGWLRVVVFVVCFCVLTLLIAIPAVISLAGVSVDTLKDQPVSTLSGLLSSNYLWLMVLLELAISVMSVGIFRLFVDRRSLGSLGWSLDAFPGEAVTGVFMGPALLGIAALLM